MLRVVCRLILKIDACAVKIKAKKNAAPVARGRVIDRRNFLNYLASPSSAGLSDLSTGLSPSQIRSSAL
jgi:hypothetical protein